ncbi:hypothetical protein [Bacillus thuringiensis]|uniref:hypothetical protein n=1 Tax=Bacillus thuringiensis TaxID=1428 RepID=UPI000BF855F1|nr:hypothetical protein [Bacillus thuringiensis]PFC01840.1 hypothetical protein CN302_09935 [Bacillus thuringiensis]
MRRKIECMYPILLGSIGGLITFQFQFNLASIKNLLPILGATVTISAIIIGFLATMVSILISLTNSNVMQRLKNAKANETLSWYIKEAIIIGFILAIYCLVLHMFEKYDEYGSKLMLSFYVGLLIYFVSTAYRIFHIILNILTSVLNESKEVDDEQTFTTPSSNIFDE